jgi:hypothetical protein
MAAILSGCKLTQYDGGKSIACDGRSRLDAVRWAEEIMREIDRKWPDKDRLAE